MVEIDAQLVRCLLREQFPQWAGAVRPVELDGWDNRTFRVGDGLAARLPSESGYAAAVDKEHRWLPVLAPHLPLPIPAPVARGAPGCGYPLPWSLYRWLPGVPARADRIDDPVRLAGDLAGFLTALQGVDPTGGPAAGAHSFGRGGPLATYDREVRETAETVDGALELWEAALSRPYDVAPVWLHGDVTASNLLLENGRLSAVIDFGTCAVGDPTCDLVIAWTLLHGEAREAFRRAVPGEPGAWARARGWALWKALLTVGDEAAVRRYGWRCGPLELIDELVAEHRG